MGDIRLTPEQQAVVDNVGGTLLVSAAAGSGKTKVLVDRVLDQIVNQGRQLTEFLMITFTNAAAAELRGKLAAALSARLAQDPENVHLQRQMQLLYLSQISTVHAFCGALLRQYGYVLELAPDFRMLEEQEGQIMLDALLADLLEEKYGQQTPAFRLLADTLGAGRTDEKLAELVFSVYETLQSQPDPDRWIAAQKDRMILDPAEDFGRTVWGRALLSAGRQQIAWVLERYDWAIAAMTGDTALEKKYLPAYRGEREQLKALREKLDGPWDGVLGGLELSYQRVSVRNYDDPLLLDQIKAVREAGKKCLETLRQQICSSSAEIAAMQNAMTPALMELLDLTAELSRRFFAEKRRRNLLDFSDQEHLAIRLLVRSGTGAPTEIAQEVSERFCEILVDEYQDSNAVQELIYRSVAKAGDVNRFLVGDVKQSIYRFRQADPGIFLEKYNAYPPGETAAVGEPRKLVLSRNFRSRPEILEAVNHVFASVMSERVGDLTYGPAERLYPGLGDGYPEMAGPMVELHVLELQQLPADGDETSTKYRREAAYVARRIQRLLAQGVTIRDGDRVHPVQAKDIAVLMRSMGAGDVYRRAFRRAGIPVAGGKDDDLFEAPEVRVLVDFLKVLDNPRQDIPLLSVLCSPVVGLSADQLSHIRTSSTAERFYDAMRACDAPWCRDVVERLERLRQEARGQRADEIVWRILEERDFLTVYCAMPDGAVRERNLYAVYELALDAGAAGNRSLYRFLGYLDHLRQAGQAVRAGTAEGVQIMTIHRSKGLEFPVVFLADLSREFNRTDLSEPVLLHQTLGVGTKFLDQERRVRYPGAVHQAVAQQLRQEMCSEELRVLYVAMTRAKDRLYMTYADRYAEGRLKALTAGAGMPAAPWAAASARCLGDWILLAALGRAEAGELFDGGLRPAQLQVSKYPWYIHRERVGDLTVEPGRLPPPPAEAAVAPVDKQGLLRRLLWDDPHRAAAATPSKLTATQLKGREKDAEAAEGSGLRLAVQLPRLTRPEFILEQQGLTEAEKGTATHLFLQNARYGCCTTEAGVMEELDRMVTEQFLTLQQAEAVSPEAILRLFRSPTGQRLLRGEGLVREFKFSLLMPAEDYYEDVAGEQVLLQGVVDAATVEEDGIHIIDFKTDRVTEQTVMRRAETYRPQLRTYEKALGRIFARPVRSATLYFFTIGREVVL